MRDRIRIAAVQTNPQLMDNRTNLDRMLVKAGEAARNGADLIVFPECALTGYVFASREEALPHAETIPGPSTNEFAHLCRQSGVHVVFGLIEVDGPKCFNAAALVGPDGVIARYRKNHLPFIGVDRFLDPGDEPFRVHKTPVGNVGLHICYDCSFPESARVMTLLGADILVLPTNWPEGRGVTAKHVVITRAFENKVNVVAVNRVGVERGTRFIGQSKIVDVMGSTLAEAGSEDEQTIYAEVSLAAAREKRIVAKPGELELDFIGDRRPELYGEIVAKREDSSQETESSSQ